MPQIKHALLAVAVAQCIEANAHAGERAPTTLQARIPGRIELKAKADNTADLYIYGDIGESWWAESVTAKAVVDQLNELDASVTAVDVYVNSYGGSVTDGLAIYNALRRKARAGVTVNTHNDGIAASIASLIMMAGDTVTMASNARFMVHAPWGGLYVTGNAVEVRKAAAEFADMLDGYSESMAKSYAAKTLRPQADMLALLTDGEDHWYSAEQAKAEGFIDTISDADAEDDAAAKAIASIVAQPAFARYFERMPAQLAASLRGAIPGATPSPRSPAAAGATPPALPGTQRDPTMPNETHPQAAAPQSGTPTVADIQAQALAAAKARGQSIRAALEPHLHIAEIRALHDDALADPAGLSAEEVNAKALRLLGTTDATPTQPTAGTRFGDGAVRGGDETDRQRAAAVDMLMARAGLLSRDEDAKARTGNPFAGMTLIDMAERSLISAGVNARGMTRMEIAQRVLARQGTGDFPILLENVLHKTLMRGYSLAELTWRRWCAIGTLSDFRPHSRYALGSFSNLLPVNENGEYVNGVLGDGEKESITAKRKGRILSVTPELIINDDLGMMTRAASALGAAANRTVEQAVFALLAANPTMGDGIALFHADHNNLAGSGAVPSISAFEAVKLAMRQQKDPSDNDYLDITPAIWLGGDAHGGKARVANDAEYDNEVSSKFQVPNRSRGTFRDIVDTPRITGNDWYAFADPNIEPVIEVAFLEGQQNPVITQEEDFRTSGLSWKVEHHYGVGAVGWRGAYKNPGAGS